MNTSKIPENPVNPPFSSHVNNIPVGSHVNNIDMANSGGGGVINKNNTTTTTNSKAGRQNLPDLKFAKLYCHTLQTERYVAALVRQLPYDEQQYPLDYVEERYMAGEKGIGTKVKDPIAYLKTIVRQMLESTFEPTGLAQRSNPEIIAKKQLDQRSQKSIELKSRLRSLDQMKERGLEPTLQQTLEAERAGIEAELNELSGGSTTS